MKRTLIFLGLTTLIFVLGYPFYSELLQLQAVKQSKKQFEKTVLEATKRNRPMEQKNPIWRDLPAPTKRTLKELGFFPATPPGKKINFSLRTPTGNRMALKDFRDTWVVLNFWATWCPPCRTEMPSLDQLQTEFRSKELRVVTINVQQSAKIVQQFRNNYGLTLPMLLDSRGKIAKQYGALGLPETWLIAPSGKPMAKIMGPLNWHKPTVIRVLKDLVNIR